VKALEERFAPPIQTELYRVQLTERRQKPAESLPELFVLSDTLPAVLSAAVVRKYERPSVTLRSALLKVSNSTASRIASFKFWGRDCLMRILIFKLSCTEFSSLSDDKSQQKAYLNLVRQLED
jgi:hypothetical protein